jgi:hypothetical protein
MTRSNKPHLLTGDLDGQDKDKDLADIGLNICHDKILHHLVDCKTGEKLASKPSSSSQWSDVPSNGSSGSTTTPSTSKDASTPEQQKDQHLTQHKSESRPKAVKQDGGSKHKSTKHQAAKHLAKPTSKTEASLQVY